MTNKDYWEDRYTRGALGWDIGYASTPLRAYIDQLEDTSLKILLPGAGFGHEVIYLYQQGFHNVFALDIANAPLQRIREKQPDFPAAQLLEGDFFSMEEAGFDLILEQTFFCALPPGQRPAYARRMHDLLVEGGRLAGLFFDFPLTPQGPPFGGSREAYRALFGPLFRVKTLERAYNSIPPRQGNELFFIFEK